MVEPVAGTAPGEAQPGLAPPIGAPPHRRLAATAVDVVLLGGGFVLALAVGVSVAAVEAVGWLLATWVLVVAPLYFACYHAFGPGSTPGQHELGLGVRDAETGARIGLLRALARAYGGVLGTLLVVPLLADVAVATWSGSGVTLHERLTRSHTVPLPLEEPAPSLALPTRADLGHVFGDARGGRHLRRGARLVRAEPRLLVGAVAAVSLGFLALATLLALLVLADSPDVGVDALPAYAYWLTLSGLLLASGVYWTQAAVTTAVEAARTGIDASLRAVLARALRQVNALSAALLLLLALAAVAWWLPPLLLVGARFALVPPALVLEDRSVLGAFRRSWALTRRRTWRTAGLALVSLLGLTVAAVLTSLALWLVLGVGSPALESNGPLSALALALVTVAALLLASVPTVLIVTVLGAGWSLLYEDLRFAAGTGS